MSETDLTFSGLPEATGYSTTQTYYGTRFIQGGRVNYLLDLSLLQILAIAPYPNPDALTEDNRQISKKHAKDFATYLREHEKWVVPGIILRTKKPFAFKAAAGAQSGAALGAISFQRSATPELFILDGQHRILGLNWALEGINADIEKTQGLIEKARRNGDTASERDFKKELTALQNQAKRFETEHIPVQIIVVADRTDYQQVFFDIADNAKGITATLKGRFDSRKAVNRAVREIVHHPLLENRVAPEADRLSRVETPYITTGKTLGEITKALLVGYDGRIGKRIEASLNDKQIVADMNEFLDMLVRAFPPLYAVQHAQLTPDDLVRGTIFGSSVFLRILAATQHELVEEHGFTKRAVEDFFSELFPHLEVPVHENSILWTQIGYPSFALDSFYPASRRQDAVAVVRAFVDWAIDKPAFLGEKPKPAPEPETPKAPEEMTEEELDEELRPEIAKQRKLRATK